MGGELDKKQVMRMDGTVIKQKDMINNKFLISKNCLNMLVFLISIPKTGHCSSVLRSKCRDFYGFVYFQTLVLLDWNRTNFTLSLLNN